MHNDFYQIHLLETEKRKLGPTHHCDYCHANLLHVGPWGWPHLCKEIIYGTPIMLPMSYLPFEGDSVTRDAYPKGLTNDAAT